MSALWVEPVAHLEHQHVRRPDGEEVADAGRDVEATDLAAFALGVDRAEAARALLLPDEEHRATALAVIDDEGLAERSSELGGWFLDQLRTIRHPRIRDVRGRGLLIGIELTVPARPFCEALMNEGLLCKETHDHVVRFAPPLVTSREDLEWALSKIRNAFSEMD